MQLAHDRRQFMEQIKSKSLKPLTEMDLLTKFHNDSAYVALVIEDAKLKRRWAPDPLCPHDSTKNRYWITDSESFEFKEGLQTSTTLSAAFDISQKDAAMLTADGAPLSSVGGQLGTAGISDLSISNVAMDFFGGGGFDGPATGGKGGGKGRKGGKAKALPAPPPTASPALASDATPPAGPFGKTSPHTRAAAYTSITHAGYACPSTYTVVQYPSCGDPPPPRCTPPPSPSPFLPPVL
jgi:hypothetical protein